MEPQSSRLRLPVQERMPGGRLLGAGLLALLLAVPGLVLAQLDPAQLSFPEIRAPEWPEVEVHTLSSGLEVHLLRDGELPLVELAAYFRGGWMYESPQVTGIHQFLARAMMEGGAGERSGTELLRRLEALGASLEVQSGAELVTLSGTALSRDLASVVGILADVIRRPRFEPGALERIRSRSLEAVRRRFDDPGELLAARFSQLVYGADSVWASLETAETLEGIHRDDLLDLHRRSFVPEGSVLAVVGDIEPGATLRLLRRELEGWTGRRPELEAPPPVGEMASEPGVYHLPRELGAAFVQMGHLGANRHSPDVAALEVLNRILGGPGLGSRLALELRERRGLAYRVGGGVGAGIDRGLTAFHAVTAPETAAESILAIRGELERIRDEPVEPGELEAAKDALVHSFVFAATSAAEMVDRQIALRLAGYPRHYLAEYPASIRAVTAEQVRDVARRHLHPDRMVVLVVGQMAQRGLLEGELRTVTVTQD